MNPDSEHHNSKRSYRRFFGYIRRFTGNKGGFFEAERCIYTNQKRSAIYNIDIKDEDPKLSDLLNFLKQYRYHLEIVQDTLEIVKDYSYVHNKPSDNLTDLVMDVNGISAHIEHPDIKRAKLDKKRRMEHINKLLS